MPTVNIGTVRGSDYGLTNKNKYIYCSLNLFSFYATPRPTTCTGTCKQKS